MSLVTNISDISGDQVENDLTIKIEPKFGVGQTKYLQPYSILSGERVCVPFAYGSTVLNIPRPVRKNFPVSKVKFAGTLRPEQKIVRKEAIQSLNKTGSVIVSGYCGFGKCLGINTPVIMYDGAIKAVQDIKKGELLMGDDSTPRTVLSTCTGEEQMYTILPEKGDSFKCNESHILSLMTDSGVVDISVKDFLGLPKSDQDKFMLYHVPVEFGEKDVDIDPYVFGLSSTPNIPGIYKYNSRNNRLKLLAGLIDSCGCIVNNCCEIIHVSPDDILYLVRSLGFMSHTCGCKVTFYGSGMEEIPVRIQPRLRDHDKDSLMSTFRVIPVDERDYYGFTIDGNHRFLLGDFTVTHNTICSINMATSIGFPTLIVVNKIVLMKQWEESILRFCPTAVVHRITAQSPKKPGDFYIMNAQNIEKKGRTFFNDVGLVIVDEAHMIMAEALSKCLQYVFPRYLLALTATPYRPDGLDILLQLYFGKNKVIRKLHREHVVYKVDTRFTPKVELTLQGRVNWGSILDQQAHDEKRNNLILKIIQEYDTRNFLVLVKRVTQGRYLLERLTEMGISVTNLIGNSQEFESTARVLIGTCQKVGTGFDHPKLDTLILAADIQEYFIQYLGRIFRIRDSDPIVFDLVDNNGILRKHYATREKIYREHGGVVHPLSL